jgi:DNA-directed RNA polymerase specialized sigma subunit
VFLSIDKQDDDTNVVYDIPDKSKEYNKDLLLAYLKGLMMEHVSHKEYQVIRLSYGLDCDKHSAKQIAEILGIKGSSSYVRVSQLKKQGIQKLIDNVSYSQVVDYL